MTNFTSETMLFSCLSGHNIYVPSSLDGGRTMIHLQSGTEVTVRPVHGMEPRLVEKKWHSFVERPIDINNILWPVDIIDLGKGTMGLVFTKRAFPKMEPLKTLLYNSNLLSWKREEIKTVVKSLLSVFDNIHKGGYAYHSFDMERIFYYGKECNILVDFTLGMSRHRNDPLFVSEMDKETIAIEFLPPWIDFSERGRLTLLDDLYSISAMLFRLLIGRMPYQGRLMDGHGDMMDLIRDTDPNGHITMFEHYHENPVFIFDKSNKTNSIGLYTHEEKFADLWNDLPERIREMFSETFTEENNKAPYEKKILYSPRQWLDALTDCGVI